MQDKVDKVETTNTKPKSRLRKIFNRLLLIFVIFICFSSLSCLLIAISTPFRQYTIENILSMANSFLRADISIKDIRFDRMQGISLEGVCVIVENDTLADVEKLIVDVSFESVLFSNIIKINHLELINPKIKLLRSKNDSL
jgi:autotransporter translocation and assembly factor TamB